MKIGLILVIVLSLVLVSGCTFMCDSFGLCDDTVSQNKVEQKLGPKDVITVKAVQTLPRSPIPPDRSMLLTFTLANKDTDADKIARNVIVDLFDAPLLKDGDTRFSCNLNPSDNCLPESCNKNNPCKVLPGAEKNIIFNLQTPTINELGNIRTEPNLNFKVSYEFSASTLYDVVVVDPLEITNIQKSGDRLPISQSLIYSSGPIKMEGDLGGEDYALGGLDATLLFSMFDEGAGNTRNGRLETGEIKIKFPNGVASDKTKVKGTGVVPMNEDLSLSTFDCMALAKSQLLEDHEKYACVNTNYLPDGCSAGTVIEACSDTYGLSCCLPNPDSDYFLKVVRSSGGGGTSGGATVPAGTRPASGTSVLGSASADAETVKKCLRSKYDATNVLIDNVDFFYKASADHPNEVGKKHVIDPVFAIAVAGLESGWGKSPNVQNNNNLFGIGGHNNYRSYNDIKAGIMDFYKLIDDSYIDSYGQINVGDFSAPYAYASGYSKCEHETSKKYPCCSDFQKHCYCCGPDEADTEWGAEITSIMEGLRTCDSPTGSVLASEKLDIETKDLSEALNLITGMATESRKCGDCDTLLSSCGIDECISIDTERGGDSCYYDYDPGLSFENCKSCNNGVSNSELCKGLSDGGKNACEKGFCGVTCFWNFDECIYREEDTTSCGACGTGTINICDIDECYYLNSQNLNANKAGCYFDPNNVGGETTVGAECQKCSSLIGFPDNENTMCDDLTKEGMNVCEKDFCGLDCTWTGSGTCISSPKLTEASQCESITDKEICGSTTLVCQWKNDKCVDGSQCSGTSVDDDSAGLAACHASGSYCALQTNQSNSGITALQFCRECSATTDCSLFPREECRTDRACTSHCQLNGVDQCVPKETSEQVAYVERGPWFGCYDGVEDEAGYVVCQNLRPIDIFIDKSDPMIFEIKDIPRVDIHRTYTIEAMVNYIYEIRKELGLVIEPPSYR